MTQPSERYDISRQPPDAAETIELPLLPVQNGVVFPGTIRSVRLQTEDIAAGVEIARSGDIHAALFTLRDPAQPPTTDNLSDYGTEVALSDLPALDGVDSVLVEGKRRLRLLGLTHNDGYIVGLVEAQPQEKNPPDAPAQAQMRAALTLFRRVLALNPELPSDLQSLARAQEDPGALADLIANVLTLTPSERLRVLSTVNPAERLRLLLTLLGKELTILEVEEEIGQKVQHEIETEQRELYLREQMRVIQGELGEGDIFEQEINEIRERIEKTPLPTDVRARALKEVSRLAMLPPMAPEIGLIHTYIDWILGVPWEQTSTDNLDIAHATTVLNDDHHGLPRVKDRILEHIAVRQLAADKMQTPILCFLGPPGTGKTSLGKSIARALGREFVRVGLGGVRDEAEIRGHRRTYVGAMPGRIIQAMRRAGTINPVMMLDEIDKIGTDFHGDPAAALLEVLDPEQNADFLDHYLDVSYDLSQVLFITTANDLYPLPAALEDRLEIIEFPGYIEEEKLDIARGFLIPRQLVAHGMSDAGIQFETAALQTIIQEYTYEAGVRGLNRRIAEVMRKLARLAAEGKRHPRRIRPKMLPDMLGPPDYTAMRANDEDQVGVVSGLAWTSSGGDVMTIEVALLPGKGALTLTGQLGEVMQESAQTALSYMRWRAVDFDVPDDDFDNYDLHIHLPEGAVPKDGPSAGVTLAIAVISVFTERKVRSDIAMTGEVTLRGKVLPVGGIREKIMAARRAGLKTVIIPELNERDLIEIPKKARRDLNIITVTDMQTIIDTVLLPPPDERERDANQQEDEDDEDET